MYQFSRKRIFQQITVALETKFHQSTPQCNTIMHPVSEWSQDYYHYSVYIFTILEKNTIEKLLVSPTTCTGTYIFSVFRLRAFAMHLVTFSVVTSDALKFEPNSVVH